MRMRRIGLLAKRLHNPRIQKLADGRVRARSLGRHRSRYAKLQALVTEAYGYSYLDRLTSVVRDGVQVDHREYDAAGHVLQTGPNGNLPQGDAAALNAGVPAGAAIGMETGLSRFDAI